MSTARTADRPKLAATTPLFSPFLARAAAVAQPDRDGPAHLGLGRRARSFVRTHGRVLRAAAGAGLIMPRRRRCPGKGPATTTGLAFTPLLRKLASGRSPMRPFGLREDLHPAVSRRPDVSPGVPRRWAAIDPSVIAAGPITELYDGVHPFIRPRRCGPPNLLASLVSSLPRPSTLAAGFDGVEVHVRNGAGSAARAAGKDGSLGL
jgi:hypothetical protein